MKTLFFILCTILLTSMSYSQVTLTQEQINSLPADQKAVVEKLQKESEITQKLETYSTWAGKGKEIGEAVNASLKAIENTAVSISEKPLGKWMIFIITWKVIGTDFIQLLGGIGWTIIILTVSYGMFRKSLNRPKVISRTWNREGKGWETKSEIIEGDEDYKIATIVVLSLGLLIAIPITFA